MSEKSIFEILDILDAKVQSGEVKNITHEDFQTLKVKTYNETEGHLNDVDGYNCGLCKNKGHMLVLDENLCECYRTCKCARVRETLRRAKKSGLGDILSDFKFDKYDDTEEWQKTIKNAAQAFCKDDEAKWFYIGGQVGCGKTFICTAISAHYIKAGYDLKYMLWMEEAKKLKALVNDISYKQEISVFKDVAVLYIDDFLKTKSGENPTPADINLAFEIINHRLMDKSKITIISSERLLDELLQYDEATMSRIYEKTGCYKFNIAKDIRKNYRLRGSTVL